VTRNLVELLRETGECLTDQGLPPFPGEEAWTERVLADIDTRRERREQSQRIWRAMMLSPSLEVCDALLRGENVPLEKLDPGWVARFGLRAVA
jgi:hypothetical protein